MAWVCVCENAEISPDLEPGTHRVEVTASDEYGRGYRDHLILEVTGEAAPNVTAR